MREGGRENKEVRKIERMKERKKKERMKKERRKNRKKERNCRYESVSASR